MIISFIIVSSEFSESESNFQKGLTVEHQTSLLMLRRERDELYESVDKDSKKVSQCSL